MGYGNQRIVYGGTLVKEGKKNDRLVVLDADPNGSTIGKVFEQAFPDRHYEVGIAEADMTSMVVGLSLTDWIPFTNSFAVFSARRACDRIRQTITVGNLNVKVVGSPAGPSDFEGGITHQAIEDMVYTRAVPNITVIYPTDASETVETVKAMIQSKEPCYLRLNRDDYDNITKEGRPPTTGKPSILKQGADMTVFTTGYVVSLALAAARELERKISVRVVGVSTIKPLDQTVIVKLVETYKGMVTTEKHTVIGGPGDAAAQALVKTGKPVKFVGINDTSDCSGHSYQGVLEHHGLTKEHIVDAVKTIWEL